ncbi:relaxase/mobilization nuclease domain-containing protein [Leucobacter luti]|uniref:Relaxase/mobilization nuclease-like protein n=1 Tax=Leucobacter luti TaxID=340320 RepID=A0A4Q7TIP9_9MICO|nr:relaxase/mobilization nuclease domain-containing protein [Leucobacter luti]MBL3700356.1 hypothetical protein [Leucobacter luti]RZT60524.1 relaxase/mobilization nuclease-like protein [Leucobacter luti]
MIAPKVSPVYDLGARADYLSHGTGDKKRKHLRQGTDRIAPGFYCDAASIEEFIALGNRLAEQHGRRVKAQSYIVSAGADELDKANPLDQQCMGDYGFMLAKRMHPNSPCMVVVHDDGGVLHAHVTVLNHDELTGLALRDYRVHWQVKRANDELAREIGMRVVEPQQRKPLDAWATRRAELSEFDQQLGDAVAEARAAALAHSQPSMAVFVAEANARGIEVVEHDHVAKSGNRTGHAEGETATGITYRMRDETTPKRRMRRRKASALSAEFTHNALVSEFEPQPAPVAPAPAPQQAAPSFSSGLAALRRQREEAEQEAQPVERDATPVRPPEGAEVPEVSAAPKAVIGPLVKPRRRPVPFVVETDRERLVREMREERQQPRPHTPAQQYGFGE